MPISLRNYRPFDCAKWVVDHGREKWNSPSEDYLDLCKKVGIIALAILAFLPALVLDLIGLATIALHRSFCRSPEEVQPLIPDERYERILASPYAVFPRDMDHQRFLRNSLTAAFGFHDEGTKNSYRELIRDGGQADGTPRIEIYQWTAGCLIVHYLRTRSHTAEKPRIGNYFLNQERVWHTYNGLIPKDKASSALAIIVPECNWQLSDRAKELVNQINAEIWQINRNRNYLQEILAPVINDRQFLNTLS